MPDIAVPYVLTGPSSAITFNDGSADQFFITNLLGLAGAPIRAPIDDLAYTDGARGYNWWKGGRHITVEGTFFVTSALMCTPEMVTVWNQMEENLRDLLDDISALETATASFAWTPTGATAQNITVRNDVPLEVQPDQNYLVRTFTFGLFAANPALA